MNPRIAALSRRVAPHVLAITVFVAVSVTLRGRTIGNLNWLNPDEAELMAQARAAMHSPVPFTTWTMGTTGPVSALFLATLGALSLPLTIVFAHLLAAVLFGLMGYMAFILMRRAMGLRTGLVVAVLWWLPIVLIFPVGGTTDFGALSTELLPTVLVLGAALVPSSRIVAHPWVFGVSGLLSGLAVGSKYQVVPLAIGLACVQVIMLGIPLRECRKACLWWVVGAASPFVLLALAIALSPDVSMDLLKQNLGFLGSYAGGVDLHARIVNSLRLLGTQKYLIGGVLILGRLAFLSSRRVLVSRLILVAAGLAAVVAGGMGFGHYLILLFGALALATALPMVEGAQLLPWPRTRRIVLPLIGALTLAVMVVGAILGRLALASPRDVAAALSEDSVPRDAALAAVCPEGSDVLVWGWAAEFYVNYSWDNTVPFMNTLGLTSSPENREAGREIVLKGIASADCVIDAVGPPFFGVDAGSSIALVYPETAAVLRRDFREVDGLLECDACTVYVRN
jgi:hypothetical protein